MNNRWKRFKVTHYTIPMTEGAAVPSEDGRGHTSGGAAGAGLVERVCRFGFLSDLHNNCYGEQNQRLLAAIDEAKPDFVVSAGDMLVAVPGKSMDVAMDFMRMISAKYPVYYGNGNHEYRLKIYPEQYKDMYDRYKKVLDSCGVCHLENADVTLEFGKRKINICGLEIDRHYYKRFRKISMNEQYIASEIGEKKDLFTILIAHNPDYFPAYAKWGANLTLSGHLHGGVMRLPKIGGVISPQCRIFPKYSGGLYKLDGKYLALSCGLGTHTIPIRINNPAELVIIDLVDVMEQN